MAEAWVGVGVEVGSRLTCDDGLWVKAGQLGEVRRSKVMRRGRG
jgi:hypothetical protein